MTTGASQHGCSVTVRWLGEKHGLLLKQTWVQLPSGLSVVSESGLHTNNMRGMALSTSQGG